MDELGWEGDRVRATFPDSKVHGANMGPIWGRQDPGGPHVGPMNFAIWVDVCVQGTGGNISSFVIIWAKLY